MAVSVYVTCCNFTEIEKILGFIIINSNFRGVRKHMSFFQCSKFVFKIYTPDVQDYIYTLFFLLTDCIY